MNFFIRLFKSPPRDDSLWNMLNENALHLSIDHQATQILKTTPQRSSARERAVALSQRYSEFTNNLATIVPTVEVLARAVAWESDAAQKLARHEVLREGGWPSVGVKQVNDFHYRAAEDYEACDDWIDAMNPQALSHGIYIKDDNDVFSPLNRHYFSACDVSGRKHDHLVISGYFHGICVEATDRGAKRRGHKKRIIDPDQVFDYKHNPVGYEDVVKTHPLSTIVTEPGQIAHVLKTYRLEM